MASPGPQARTLRARIAQQSQHVPADHPTLVELRREFRAARLADHVNETLSGIPPLSDEQRVRVAALLAPRANA